MNHHMTIKEALNKTEKVTKQVIDQTSVTEDLLGIHEAVTKLWVARKKSDGNDEESAKRLSNILFGTLNVANKLGVDLEESFEHRVTELMRESRNQ